MNSKNEIYLTDTISLLKKALHFEIDNPFEIKGINDRVQLSECEHYIQEELKSLRINKGVSFVDPISCSLSEDSNFGTDVIIEPQTHLRGPPKAPGPMPSSPTFGSQVMPSSLRSQ